LAYEIIGLMTNDHTVPQMYLRRFARKGRGKAHQLVAARADDLNATFVSSVRNVGAVQGFHWGVDPDGVEHHLVENLLTSIETAAGPAFSAVLDTAWALPERWPPRQEDRGRLSWWIAAQILRTRRQRHRLDHLASRDAEEGPSEALAPPTAALHRFAENNRHLAFITTHLAPLAAIVAGKPWGIGFSSACLPTSDAPVVLMNGQDAERQLLSAAFWDVLLPLDPHRFLLMPGRGSQPDPATRHDHRLELDGGLGALVIDLIASSADEHVFWHPEHEPPRIRETTSPGSRLPRPWVGETHESPQWILQYDAMPPGTTVERRWLTEHPPTDVV
jgi:hypothetical protein